MDWVPDPPLTRLIERGHIRVGMKLITAGADLIQAPSGFGGDKEAKGKGEDAHLFGDTSNGLALRLNGNSTVPASPNARLGFACRQPMAHLPPIPLSGITSDGGGVSCVCVLIQVRVYFICLRNFFYSFCILRCIGQTAKILIFMSVSGGR